MTPGQPNVTALRPRQVPNPAGTCLVHRKMVAIRPWQVVAGFHPALGGPTHPDAVMSPACALLEPSPARHAGTPRHPILSTPIEARRGSVTIDLMLRHAGLHRLDVHYEIQGDPASPLVVVGGGISATRHVARSPADPTPGWWDAQVGDDLAIDPRHHCILAIDWVGADGRLDVPIDTADQADAIRAVLDALSLPRIALFVGCSYASWPSAAATGRIHTAAPRARSSVARSHSAP